MKNQEIIISGNHLELTEAIKSIAHEKMQKLFRHEEHIIRIRLELSYHHKKGEGDEFIAKGHIEINGPDLHAVESSNDLYQSIDKLVNILDRKLRQRVQKFKSRRHDNITA